MILTNRKIVDSLNSIPIDDFYIITDFDGTLTKDNGISSWASIFKNPKVNEEFVDEYLTIIISLKWMKHCQLIRKKLSWPNGIEKI